MDQTDVEKLKQAYDLINDVRGHVDCEYCRKHIDTILMMIEDAVDIIKFNVLYKDDPKAIEKLRELLKDEAIMRFIAVASKIFMIGRVVRYGRRAD